MKLRIDPAAEEETQEAAEWYEDRRLGLGLEFLAAVDAGVQRIRHDPLAFPLLETLPEEHNVRRFVLRDHLRTPLERDPHSGYRTHPATSWILEKASGW
jgi:hypothetical protein